MSRLGSPVSGSVIDFDPFTSRTEADETHQLGVPLELEDGRKFRHGKAGASNISKGKLQLAPAPKANHANIASAAASLGATQLTLTPGATAVVVGEYDEGFVSINDVDGEGATYKISHNPAANASTAFVLQLAEAISGTALTANSEVTLVHNTWNGLVEAASKTRRAGGVPLISVSAGDYGWFQVKGVAAVLADQAVTLGSQICASGSVAGAVIENSDVTAPQAEVIVGQASILAGVDTEYRPVVLTIN